MIIGWMHLLCKPNNSPNKLEVLRPICLQHPINKVLTDLHYQMLQEFIFRQIRRTPLYAYLPIRNTKDSFLIITDHCRQTRDLCNSHTRDPDPAGPGVAFRSP